MPQVDICPMSWEFYFPVLSVFADGQERNADKFHADIAEYLHLSYNAKQEQTAAGHTKKYVNRSDMAAFHMRKLGWIESKRRGVMQITAKGSKVLAEHPNGFAKNYVADIMRKVREVSAYYYPVMGGNVNAPPKCLSTDIIQMPEDEIEQAVSAIEEKLAYEIQESLKQNTPKFFEKVAVKLLEKMGYGSGKRVGGPGDGGIDGIIFQDPLGLDKIFIQAKRYENSVGPSHIREFSGALTQNQATKGVFITTADFTEQAKEDAKKDQRIRLINGQEVSRLMIKNSLGCTTKTSIVIKEIDYDYFRE